MIIKNSNIKSCENQDKSLDNKHLLDISSLIYNNKKGHVCYNNINSKSKSKTQYLPIIIDTEFQSTSPNEVLQGKNTQTNILTVQAKLYNPNNDKNNSEIHSKGVIYAHKDNPNPRHPIMTEDFIVFQVLKDYTRNEIYYDQKYVGKFQRKLTIVIYTHFGVAELNRMCTREIKEQFIRGVLNKNIVFKRRLKTSSNSKNSKNVPFQLEGVLLIDNIPYRVNIEFVDTVALVGNCSYKRLAGLAGVVLPHKDTLSLSDKEKMLDTYTNKPFEFDKYSLGDLLLDQMFLGIYKNLKEIVKPIIGDNFEEKDMKLTFGSTVAGILKKVILQMVDQGINKLDEDEKNRLTGICSKGKKNNRLNYLFFKELTRLTCAQNLKSKIDEGIASACKTDGGRCRSNRPLDTKIVSPIADIDISSCYSSAMSSIPYPVGRPYVYGCPMNTGEKITIKTFLKTFSNELGETTWFFRFSTTKNLSFDQDIFVSWIRPKSIEKLFTETHLDDENKYYDPENTGESVILLNEIQHGVLTSDLLDLARLTWSKKEWEEFIENTKVENAIIFLKNHKKDHISEVLKDLGNPKLKNKVETKLVNGKPTLQRTQGCCSWYPIELKIVEKIKNLRNEAKKKYGKKSPQEQLYKLLGNTLYGVTVSPYFDIGNVVFANNVTARARVMAYMMEKGFHGFQTITDGCSFDLNQMVFINDPSKFNSQ
ncbi:MAG: hypothetical protein KDH96_06575, partial [Candidatus Riesia sp.]|nr:hypothetical protein [Candidatus Riesia sp.]